MKNLPGLRQAVNYYKSCMDTNQLDALGITPMTSALQTFGGWPDMGINSTQPFSFQHYFTVGFTVFPKTALFLDMGVTTDARDALKNMIEVCLFGAVCVN